MRIERIAMEGAEFPPGRRGYRPAAEARAFAPGPAPGGASRLLLTVDVEEQFDWSRFSPTDHRVDGAAALAAFHRSCRGLGVRPVYLATYAILRNPAFRDFLTEAFRDGSAEIGIHLHPWITPPHWERPDRHASLQCNLPQHLERRKLQVMCEAFASVFATAPRIHRAGRWGGSERGSWLLERLGIPVDLSPCAERADLAAVDGQPFWDGRAGRTLVVPASSAPFLRGPDRLSSLLRRRWPLLPGIGERLHRRFGNPVRFSPEGSPTHRLRAMLPTLAARPVTVLSLHSTSLYAGGSPYSRDAAAAARIRDGVATILRECLDSGLFRPTTCAALHDEASARRAQRRRDCPRDSVPV